jgi:phosphomannomutase
MKTIKEVILQSGINFGTSGARGLVTDFTPQTCTAFTISFLDAIKKRFEFTKVAVAMDNRPSSPNMASYICVWDVVCRKASSSQTNRDAISFRH